MGKVTGIRWTHHTFNPWWICTEVSPGCDRCYARELAARFGYEWGKGVPRREFGDKHRNEPLAWNRHAEKTGKAELVFCASMCDVMDDEAPAGARERLWALIDETPNLIWQLLTKRPQRFAKYLPKEFKHANVWLGITAENQDNYNLRAPYLMDASIHIGTPAFISYEPALGPLSMKHYPNWAPDWLICGGESGADARPMLSDWAFKIRDECQERGTAFFFKQWSEWVDCGCSAFATTPHREIRHAKSDGAWWDDPIPPDENADVHTMKRVGVNRAGILLAGREWSEFPKQYSGEMVI